MGEQPYRTLQDIEGRQSAIRAELSAIDQIEHPTEDDLGFQETLIQEYDGLEERAVPLRTRMSNLNRIIHAAQEETNLEPAQPEPPAKRTAPEMFVRSNRDPFEDLEAVVQHRVTREDLRARAAAVIEMDSKRYDLDHDRAETATRRSQQDHLIAAHILLVGTQQYREAFRAYLDNPYRKDAIMAGLPDSLRAMNLTNASGGFLLPYVLDPTVIATNAGAANPFRRISRVVQTTSNAWQGVTSDGVNAAWVSEGATAGDASPGFAQVKVVTAKAAAWLVSSFELDEDTNIGSQLPDMFTDARDRLESAAFVSGGGSGASPPAPGGVLISLGTTTGTGNRVAPGTTGNALSGTASTPDLYNLQGALPARFRRSAGAAFIANLVALNRIRALDVYGGGSFWANLREGNPERLLNVPIYESSDMSSTMSGASGLSGTANAVLLYGDFNQFVIADKVGTSMIFDPLLKSSGNAQLPTGQQGWYYLWRVGSTVATTAAFKYLPVS